MTNKVVTKERVSMVSGMCGMCAFWMGNRGARHAETGSGARNKGKRDCRHTVVDP